MQKKHIMLFAKKMSKISRKKVIISTVAVVLSLCVIMIGVLVAKYLNEKTSDGLVKAKNFYFTSNLLDGKEHTVATDSTSFTFTLGNHEDDLRYSEVDISYEVTVDNGATVTSGGIGTLAKDVISDAEVTVSNLQPGTYNIKAVGTGGYSKTLTATIVVPDKETKLYYHIDGSAGEYTVLTLWNEGDEEGSVTVEYTGIPDNTNLDMVSWRTNENHTVTIKPHESKQFRFFGETVNINVTGADAKELY